jgi:hypothetical protein
MNVFFRLIVVADDDHLLIFPHLSFARNHPIELVLA